MRQRQNISTEITNQKGQDPSAQISPPELVFSTTSSKPSSSNRSTSIPKETITTTINVYKVIEKANTTLDSQ